MTAVRSIGALALGLHVALACAVLAGCIEERCDPGFEAQRGVCHPIRVDSGPPPAVDAGLEAGAAACEPGEGFGVSCVVEEDDCTCGTRCLPVLEICSVTDCEDEAGGCPPDWTCADVSAASPNPDVTSVCLPPP